MPKERDGIGGWVESLGAKSRAEDCVRVPIGLDVSVYQDMYSRKLQFDAELYSEDQSLEKSLERSLVKSL